MRLTILELEARWGASTHVLAEVDARLAAKCDADLVLLPEAALHGYVSPEGDSDLGPFAESLDGPTARACAALAVKYRIYLVAPLVLREGPALFNAMVCFGLRGELVFVYRKRHPWIPETWATAGNASPPVVAIAGAVVTIAICYDLHFLSTDAVRELEASDVLLFPSAWVEEPDHRVLRLSQLAQHYGLTIANANWAPGDVRVPGQGGSCVVGPDGHVSAHVEAGRIDHVWISGAKSG